MTIKQNIRALKIYMSLYILALIPGLLIYIEPFASAEATFLASFNMLYLLYPLLIASSFINIYYFMNIHDKTTKISKSLLGFITTLLLEILIIIFIFIESNVLFYFMLGYIPTILSIECGVIVTFIISCIIGEEYYSRSDYKREKTREELGGF